MNKPYAPSFSFSSSKTFQTFVSFLAVWMLASAASAQDEIFPISGTNAIRGSITDMSPTQVTIDIGSGKRNVEVNEIKRITFRDDPVALRQARNAVLGGRFEDAVRLLNEAMGDSFNGVSDYVKGDAAFYKAYAMTKLALSGQEDTRAAAAAVKGVLDTYPNNYHHYEATELFGDLAVAFGRYDAAAEQYEELAKAPWPDYKMRSAVLVGKALMLQNKYAEALPKFEAVLNSSQNSPQAQEQKQFAQAAKVKCLAHTGQAEQGIDVMQELISKNDPQNKLLFGQAYNALGTCYLKSGKPKEALLAFLHVDILFFQDPETHAEALYYLAKLWADLNHSDRSVRARGLLKSRYSGTPWAKME